MKTLLLAFCLLATTSLLAQSTAGVAALSSEPVVVQFTNHYGHAIQQNMAEHQNIMEESAPVSAQGVRPLWEVAPKPVTAVPLGDVARMLKKEKLDAKKATIVWEN